MDLKCMTEENRCQSRGDLLDDIKRGSRVLEQQLFRFTDWIGDRKIVSFVEMQQTKKLQKVCEIQYIYPAESSSNGLWQLLVFPAFIASSSQSRPRKSARKYMQGPAVTAQHPDPPFSLTKKKRRNRQKIPTSRPTSENGEKPLLYQIPQLQAQSLTTAWPFG